ncbi:PREDICTED: protocadherin gamma-C5-like [Tinamus guttatus]|uniref:protocadherin gamma-C5-like n=1 Tax=Tinamus guttatus TaxID=94827 RepID=UPI00052E8FBD|nr:PREDICTED: protocadherin gamma-C5-like [Tinamus guttatus]
MVCVSLQRPTWKWQVLSLFSLCGWGWVSGQIRYSVVEESEVGTVVGNVAKDLGLKVEELSGRRLRLGSEESLRYFAVRLESGALVVSEQLDRERLCGAAASCVLSVQVVTENPLELFRLEVEILDLNDNSPSFPTSHRTLRISESATAAARFPLESAQDPDVGTNTVGSYRLSPNSHFSLDVKQLKDGKLFPELVLERTLDREEQPELQLVLTAVDGGSPALSGTAQITILVLDSNDNAPSFDRTVYKVRVPENTPTGALLLQLNASDPDEGPNGETQYSFGVHTPDSVRGLFTLDPHSGDVRVSGALDFEESPFYEIHVRARDGGMPEMEGHCVLQVEVEDANDNPPEVLLTSLLNPLPEDTPPETVVGLFNVRDRDSGANGEVSLAISPNVPFAVRSLQNHYSLVTRESLDRETTPQYAVELVARDGGSPALTTRLTLLLNISDVNDNAPRFSQASYDTFLLENNPPGSLLCTISASDPDDGVNSRLVYSIEGGHTQGAPTSSFVHIDPDSGHLYVPPDLQVLPVTVAVRDSGSPPLRANVTVYIFVLDQNDHPPRVLHPAGGSDVPAPQRVPLSAPPGYLVTKVTAVDADAGHNAWLSYHLLPQSTEPSLFRVVPYTGEVRTARALRDTDVAAQQVLVLVQDNGDPPLSTTVTIAVVLEEAATEESYKPRDFLAGTKEKPDLTLYLIIALAAVSTMALATFTVLAACCVRRRGRATGSPCCCWLSESPSRDFFKQASPKLQLSSDGTLKYMEVTLRPTDSQSQCYRTCFSPGSDRSDFTFMRPCPALGTLARETDSFLSATGTLQGPSQLLCPDPLHHPGGAHPGRLRGQYC